MSKTNIFIEAAPYRCALPTVYLSALYYHLRYLHYLCLRGLQDALVVI